MPIIYESVYYIYPPLRKRQLQEMKKTYRIPFSSELKTGYWAWETYASEEKQMEIRWDPKTTTIVQTILRVSVHAIQPWGAPSAGFNISVNGLPAISRDWLGGCTIAASETNINGKITNGTNLFKLEVHKNTSGVGNVGFDSILVEVECTFMGTEPEIKPTPITWQEKLADFLQKNGAYIALGGVGLVGLYLGGKYLIERRRK